MNDGDLIVAQGLATSTSLSVADWQSLEQALKRLLDEFIEAMKEDLSDWIGRHLNTPLTSSALIPAISNGVLLCRLAQHVQDHVTRHCAYDKPSSALTAPRQALVYRERGALPGSFVARDNVANFIAWCRDLGISDSVIMESDDLVLEKNIKRVVLTLMDVARKASKIGLQPPELIRMEQEIDAEMELSNEGTSLCSTSEVDGKDDTTASTREESSTNQTDAAAQSTGGLPVPLDLDKLVKSAVSLCCCNVPLFLKKLSNGKYCIGKSRNIVFVRILRSHVMVRVGGGWDTLDHYLLKHDPCRVHMAEQRGASEAPTPAISTVIQQLLQTPDRTSLGSSQGVSPGLDRDGIPSASSVPSLATPPSQETTPSKPPQVVDKQLPLPSTRKQSLCKLDRGSVMLGHDQKQRILRREKSSPSYLQLYLKKQKKDLSVDQYKMTESSKAAPTPTRQMRVDSHNVGKEVTAMKKRSKVSVPIAEREVLGTRNQPVDPKDNHERCSFARVSTEPSMHSSRIPIAIYRCRDRSPNLQYILPTVGFDKHLRREKTSPTTLELFVASHVKTTPAASSPSRRRSFAFSPACSLPSRSTVDQTPLPSGLGVYDPGATSEAPPSKSLGSRRGDAKYFSSPPQQRGAAGDRIADKPVFTLGGHESGSSDENVSVSSSSELSLDTGAAGQGVLMVYPSVDLSSALQTY